MPRDPDIGWQHGKMIGGHRHHVQCNYCHRIMIGGITRFKKHLASKRGEVKGCEAVPKEVREMIKKHLSMLRTKKKVEKKKGWSPDGAVLVPSSIDHDMDSDALDSDEANARRELLSFQEAKAHPPKSSEQSHSSGTKEFFDAFSSIADKEEQGLAPPRATDLGWVHGTMVNGDRQKIKCRYCRKVILGGGISRLKQHLAGERGNIAPCEKVPDDVKAQMQQHLGFKILERLNKQKETEMVKVCIQHNKEKGYDGDIPIATSTRSSYSKRRGKELDWGSSSKRKGMKLFVPQSTSHLSFASQESNDQADIAVAEFMYHAGIPFNAANSFYFQRMADAIAAVGPGYKMPSYNSLQGKLLDKCALEIGESVTELRKSWEVTGCTVMVDRWAGLTGQARIDFFVYCPKGTVFLKSVDAFDFEDCLDSLVSLFDIIVQDVGPRNIVNLLTDSTPCYKAAARLLMNRYKTFFSSICANDCIELMLNGLGKMNEVKEILAKAKKVCQLIYNNAWALDLMRKQTEGRDIFQPAMTEFVTKFITLQNIVSLKECLHQMFTSSIWEQSIFAKQRLGVDVREIVLDPHFWLSSEKIMKVSKPLVTVLHLDSKERPSMAYLYDTMEKAKKAIISAFDNKKSEYFPYLEVIEQAQYEFHSPLHTAAYYLNPSTYYNPTFSTTSVIQKGLLDCIETLVPNLAAQDNITRDKAFYEDVMGDFSRPVALRGRESLAPATWWSLYASDYPDLQRFAVRILSQTCSINTCERSRDINYCTHSTKNRLERQRLNDLTFVHYNLQLQQKQPMVSGRKGPTRCEYDAICLEGKNINTGDWIEDPGVLEEEGISGMDMVLPRNAILAMKDDENIGIDDGGPHKSDNSDDGIDDGGPHKSDNSDDSMGS